MLQEITNVQSYLKIHFKLWCAVVRLSSFVSLQLSIVTISNVKYIIYCWNYIFFCFFCFFLFLREAEQHNSIKTLSKWRNSFLQTRVKTTHFLKVQWKSQADLPGKHSGVVNVCIRHTYQIHFENGLEVYTFLLFYIICPSK